ETAKMPLQKALRRASRKAFLWPEEAALLLRQNRSLTELPGVGPYLSRLIYWLDRRSATSSNTAANPQVILSLPEARTALAKDPSWSGRLKGDLQMHTQWSDGSGSIQEMARAASDRGYDYIAITDHSKGLKIAGGIDEHQLAQQADEIAEVNPGLRAEGYRLRVLRSIELNLDPSGNGDMEERCLGRLDIVLGCFHSALRRKDDQTARYLAALRNPTIQILGHPRGRIYNYRPGLEADWPRVFDTAAELDKAVEVDAYPDRQDLSLDLLRIAKKSGCRISFGTDSHGPSQLAFIELALATALMAGIRADHILNFLPAKELLTWVSQIRKRFRS